MSEREDRDLIADRCLIAAAENLLGACAQLRHLHGDLPSIATLERACEEATYGNTSPLRARLGLAATAPSRPGVG